MSPANSLTSSGADDRDELALQAVGAVQLGQVGHRRSLGGVAGAHVLEHDQEVVDLPVRAADAGGSPVQPDVLAGGADGIGVGLDRLDLAQPEGPELEKDLLELGRTQEVADQAPRHLGAVGHQQGPQPWVGLDDPHLDVHPGDAQRRPHEDGVDEARLRLALALGRAHGVLGGDLVGDVEHDAHQDQASAGGVVDQHRVVTQPLD